MTDEKMRLDPDSWEASAQYLLESCPFTVWQRPGGGDVDLIATLVVTFRGMQMRLEGHPMFGARATEAQIASARAEERERCAALLNARAADYRASALLMRPPAERFNAYATALNEAADAIRKG